MGRKPDPRGKDRPRTIVLAGDVAEIADNLAQKNELSATLSELLRHNFGFGDKIEEKKRELEATHEHRLLLQRKEEDLAAAIDSMEEDFLTRQNNIKPNLEKRRKILLDRLEKTNKKLHFAFDHVEINRLHKQISNIQLLIGEVDLEMEELE